VATNASIVQTLQVVNLRRAQLKDERQLAAIDRATWSTDNSPVPLWVDSVDFYSADPVKNVIVADHEGATVGYVKLRGASGPGSKPDDLSISGIAVCPDYQRQGLGNRLLAEAIEEARRRGAHRLTLHVLQTNTSAIHLYEALGFSISAVHHQAFTLDDRSVDDVLMERVLTGTRD
jgi:ribosomal protein S18 acetylase RimI-like enzyme